jgi:SlyX protein
MSAVDTAQDIIDLQARIAFQESAIEELTRQLLRQQAVIESLQRDLAGLNARLADLAPASPVDSAPEPPPPHY